jgi:hypothetical protein
LTRALLLKRSALEMATTANRPAPEVEAPPGAAEQGPAGAAAPPVGPGDRAVSGGRAAVALRSPLVLGAALGCGATAAALPLGLGDGPAGAVWLGVKVAIAVWGIWTTAQVVVAIAAPAPPAEAPGETPLLGRWPAWQIAVGGGVLLIAGLQRAPQRLALNLVAYALLSAFAVWIVQRRGGRLAAARVAAVVAAFAVVATTADRRMPLAVEATRPGSAVRWSVGWPEPLWVLRQEVRLTPGERLPGTLEVPLATAYDGPAQILVRANGVELGPMERDGPAGLRLALPEDVVRRAGTLVLELRQRPFDPEQRLIAQRWTAGATLGSAASSYFDGQAWRRGTFDDAVRRRQDGVYVLQLKEGS